MDARSRLAVLVAALSAFAAFVAVGCVPRSGHASPEATARDSGRVAGSVPESAPGDTLLTLDRGPCFGTCPSYGLTVFRDGRVVYTGRRHVEVADTVRAQISDAKVQRLVAQFQAGDYLGYQRSYSRGDAACTAFATDHPTVRTSFRWDGQRQRVQHYHGCYARREGGQFERAEPLARLTALEDTVDAIVGTARWTGAEP